METSRSCLMLLLHANNLEVARKDEELALKISISERYCGRSPRDSIPIASAKLIEHVPQSVEGSVSETVKYGFESHHAYKIIRENSP
jgi:hypothetical protein